MEILQPTENLGVYANQTDAAYNDWYLQPMATAASRPLAENVILLAIRWIYSLPDGNLAYTYSYNSRSPGTGSQPLTQHQLPPRAEITLVVLDEASAQRAYAAAGTNAPALVPNNLFVDPAKLPEDRAALESSLASQRYRFRTFSGEVYIKSAKWSTQ
jgi:uncharacterized protein (TIGR02599 family)